jgi:hypothetical protein
VNYTYYLHGGPRGELNVLRGQVDEPPHVLTIERKSETGVCDLYVLTNRSEAFGTCKYSWHMSGDPEGVMKEFAELAKAAAQR